MNGNGKRVGNGRADSGRRRGRILLRLMAAGALLLTGACMSLSDWSEAPGAYGYDAYGYDLGGYGLGGYGFGGYGLYPGGGFYDPFFLSPYSSGFYDPFLWSGPGYLYGYSAPALSGRNRYDGNRWHGDRETDRPRRTRPPQATTRPGDPPALGWRRDGRGIGSPDGVRYGTVPRGTMPRGTNTRGTVTPGTSPQPGWQGHTRRDDRPQAARPERSAPPERRFDQTPRRAAGNPGWERRSSGGWQGGSTGTAPRGNPGGRRGGR